MTKCEELAIAVLMESGKIFWSEEKGYYFAGKSESKTVNAMVVVPGRLPWLMVEKKEPGDYCPTTPQGRVFCAVKMALGLDWKDRAYDAAMYKRSARALNQLLLAFTTEQECAEFVLQYGDEMREAGIENWGIDSVVRKAYNTKGKREQMK